MKVIQSSPQKNEYFKIKDIESGNVPESTEGNVVNIYDDVQYQEVLGFGGALTEAAAYNYSLMDDKTKKLL